MRKTSKTPRLNTSTTLLISAIALTAVTSLIIPDHGFATTTPAPPNMTQTKVELKALENKMALLSQTLNVVNNKRETLNLELARTEKEISGTVRQLATIQHNIDEKQAQILVLKQLIDTLNTQMTTQRTLLAKHLKARYKMGEYQPFKWLLNQENPYTITRLLTYYQYVVKKRQETIQQVLETQTRLHQNQEKLKEETEKQHVLENQIKQHQHELTQNKRYHATLLSSLNKEIQNKQQTMAEYHQNKKNLSQLMQTLAQQGLSVRHYPLKQIHRHLPKPVDIPSNQIQKINQGIAFFADEGTKVSAVYPGKVVFSDWLKGYGLLIIIDHGAGYMTLYAHNQALFKQKGAFVDQGEKIATVGHSGGLKKNGLYFEVRHGGKAIPPLEWLA